MSGYQPPLGPPPEKSGHRLFPSESQYEPPPGPPPGHFPTTEHRPPLGPPPSHASSSNDAPPPYHDWTVIPDTALLPPPPSVSHDFSTGANATRDEADQAKKWCYFNPLWQARPLSNEQLNAVHAQAQTLVKPPNFTGEIRQDRTGAWLCQTRSHTRDSLLQTALPVYSALADSPLVTEQRKTIYFEVKIMHFGDQAPKSKMSMFARNRREEDEVDAGLAIGYFAPPYPSFRLPGWQRGSLGVHSDDGRRYVNDTHGGIDFTSPFKAGQTVGLGMTFSIPDKPPAYGCQSVKLEVEVFFTRDGRKEGSWNLHEERDEKDDPHGVEGLEGQHDIFPAVGVFGAVGWEVRFREREWLYRPPR
ncbi:uncharacterized protein PV09_00604 [Verruconis gallopava]|uniref:SPRY domain-containing protein n=1 Tax=Verruconis gallopava TaxID=253628 RepID=A0A0D2BBF5_9PEZI|nr:uncharacterized protein PV09_00604 [Verruconis gallopava]KIW08649.1 hypothetical protein PV09_00604 [Verruconis gallopava]